MIPVRCLGSVNSILIADAVSRGFDGVALLGCKPGEDYQCHFIRGSELLETRMGNVQETLERLALERERVPRHRGGHLGLGRASRACLEEFVTGDQGGGSQSHEGLLTAMATPDHDRSRLEARDHRARRPRSVRVLPVRDVHGRLPRLDGGAPVSAQGDGLGAVGAQGASPRERLHLALSPVRHLQHLLPARRQALQRDGGAPRLQHRPLRRARLHGPRPRSSAVPAAAVRGPRGDLPRHPRRGSVISRGRPRDPSSSPGSSRSRSSR